MNKKLRMASEKRKIVEIKSLKAYKNKVAKQNLEEKRFF